MLAFTVIADTRPDSDKRSGSTRRRPLVEDPRTVVSVLDSIVPWRRVLTMGPATTQVSGAASREEQEREAAEHEERDRRR